MSPSADNVLALFAWPRGNVLDDLYQYNFFDWCILVPYFAILITFSIFGSYRYIILLKYWRHRAKCLPATANVSSELPMATIQLPLYNEQFVVERLLDTVVQIDYPRNRLQIQVLDDSTDDTAPLAKRLVADYSRQGVPIEYHHRSERTGFKAGALQEGLRTASGDVIAIFDADFLPPADFLLRTVQSFDDPTVGVVQTRWTFENRDQNTLTEVQGLLLDAHFVLEHGSRYRRGSFFNFNGTAGILRRKMIEDAGGWQHDTLTEDADLSYRAQLRGWRFVYLNQVECPSELPADMRSFQVQQFRWSKGLTQVARKLLPGILHAPISVRQKIESIFYLTPNVCYPLTLLLSFLVVPAMIVRFSIGWFQMLTIDLPLIATSFLPICLFYVLAARELHPRGWRRSIFLLPALMAVGIGLTISNTRAFIEAVTGRQSEFIRTPKYAARVVKEQKRRNGRRLGWQVLAEFAMGVYFALAVMFEISRGNYGSVPFLALFFFGFLGTATAVLFGGIQDAIRIAAKHPRMHPSSAAGN